MIQADGGTRCASITGGWIALRLAVNKLMKAGDVITDPLVDPVAAVSCGIYAGQPVLDLDYPEDSEAGVDGNFIMTGIGQLIEVQMSAEGSTYSRDQMNQLMDLAEKGVAELVALRRRPRMTRKFTANRILIATHNAGKLEEMRQLFAPFGVTVWARQRWTCPNPKKPRHVRRQRPDQGACGAQGHRPARAFRRFRASRSTRWTSARVYTADWAETPNGRDFIMAMTKTHDLLRESCAPHPDARGFAARWFWPGPTAMTRFSRARSRARSSGRCAVQQGMATTRCFSPTAMTRHSAKWIDAKRTRSAIAPMLSPNLCGLFWLRIGNRAALAFISTGHSARQSAPIATFNSHVAATLTKRAGERPIFRVRPYAALKPGRVLNSVFFGGGTPSLMDPETVGAIIAAIATLAPANDLEITLEANPGSVEAGSFAATAMRAFTRLHGHSGAERYGSDDGLGACTTVAKRCSL